VRNRKVKLPITFRFQQSAYAPVNTRRIHGPVNVQQKPRIGVPRDFLHEDVNGAAGCPLENLRLLVDFLVLDEMADPDSPLPQRYPLLLAKLPSQLQA